MVSLDVSVRDTEVRFCMRVRAGTCMPLHLCALVLVYMCMLILFLHLYQYVSCMPRWPPQVELHAFRRGRGNT